MCLYLLVSSYRDIGLNLIMSCKIGLYCTFNHFPLVLACDFVVCARDGSG